MLHSGKNEDTFSVLLAAKNPPATFKFCSHDNKKASIGFDIQESSVIPVHIHYFCELLLLSKN